MKESIFKKSVIILIKLYYKTEVVSISQLLRELTVWDSNGRINVSESFSWPYLFGLIKKWEKEGIVSIFKNGRECLVKLTPKGREIAHYLIKIGEVIEKKNKSLA
ncbi:MAG: hypothetical protein QXG39_00020 [Candidatus Aenigmatarchaeota archaeon]